MLFLSVKANAFKKKELYYYNLVEQGKITKEDLKKVSYYYYARIDQLLLSEDAEFELDEAKDLCLIYLGLMCNAIIEHGTDIVLSDGNTYHFSLSIEDQQNIKNAVDIANMTQSSVPYHADGELCKMFSVEDINKIYLDSIMYITYQTTYFNLFKNYIQNCDDIKTIINSYYSMELPEEYNNRLNQIISESKNVVTTVNS